MIRMNVNRILPLMLLLVLFASCSRKYKVEGVSSVTSLDGKMLYLKTLRDGQWIAIDSAEVVHGLFSTSGPSDSVMMVTLYMNDEAIMPLVLENGKIEVSISNSQLTAKGTPLNNALYEFIEKRNSLELKIEELEKKEARMVLDGAVKRKEQRTKVSTRSLKPPGCEPAADSGDSVAIPAGSISPGCGGKPAQAGDCRSGSLQRFRFAGAERSAGRAEPERLPGRHL